MDFSIVKENLGLYLTGLNTTVQLVFFSLIIGLSLAIPFAILITSRKKIYSIPISLFVLLFRGTPLLVQIFIMYYGLGQFEYFKSTFLWSFFQEAYFCALFAFALNTCAYTTEILRGAIEATPKGEVDAAKAFGMSYWVRLKRIVLPSALRRSIPVYSNEVIFMLHGSSLASVITLVDITGAARIVNSRFYSPYEAFLPAAFLYLVLTFIIVAGFKWLEKKYMLQAG